VTLKRRSLPQSSAPVLVKTSGSLRRPPRPAFDVAIATSKRGTDRTAILRRILHAI
jgi:hypothetical protein